MTCAYPLHTLYTIFQMETVYSQFKTIEAALQEPPNDDVTFLAKLVSDVNSTRDDKNRQIHEFELADETMKVHVTSFQKSSRDLTKDAVYLCTQMVNKHTYFISKYTLLSYTQHTNVINYRSSIESRTCQINTHPF